MAQLADPPIRSTRIPPLRNGENLTAAEFEQRDDAMPDGVKAELIAGAGVGEYVIWRTLDRQFDQLALTADGRFDRVPVGADGVVRSTRFPGLWLDTAALVALDSTAAFATLHQGLASAEHAAFAADLADWAAAAATGRPRP